MKPGPAKTQRAALENELFKLRGQHAASLAKALSCCFSPDDEEEHEERIKRMALLVQQLQALDAGIASRPRDEILVEITDLRKQQLEAAPDAVFGNLTPEQEDEDKKRGERLADLIRELDILNNLSERSA